MSRMFDCYLCGASVSEPHVETCPLVKRQPAPPTEMTSLKQIKDKLDALAESQKRIEEQLLTKAAASQVHVIAESQVWITGFLKGLQSKMDEQFAGLHETAMRNHAQLLDGQKAISQRLDAKDNAKFLSNMESMKPRPRKASKKARSAVAK